MAFIFNRQMNPMAQANAQVPISMEAAIDTAIKNNLSSNPLLPFLGKTSKLVDSISQIN